MLRHNCYHRAVVFELDQRSEIHAVISMVAIVVGDFDVKRHQPGIHYRGAARLVGIHHVIVLDREVLRDSHVAVGRVHADAEHHRAVNAGSAYDVCAVHRENDRGIGGRILEASGRVLAQRQRVNARRLAIRAGVRRHREQIRARNGVEADRPVGRAIAVIGGLVQTQLSLGNRGKRD